MFAVILHPSDELLLAREQKRFLEKANGAWFPSFPLWTFFDEREPQLLGKAKADAASFSIETPHVEECEFFFPVTLAMKNGEIFRGKICAAKRRMADGADDEELLRFAYKTRFPLSCRVFRAADVEITESGGTRTWLSRKSWWIKTQP